MKAPKPSSIAHSPQARNKSEAVRYCESPSPRGVTPKDASIDSTSVMLWAAAALRTWVIKMTEGKTISRALRSRRMLEDIIAQPARRTAASRREIFFIAFFLGWAEKVSNPPASGFGADYTTRRRKCGRRQRRGRIPRIRLPCALLFPFPAKAGIQIGSAEYGGIETLPAFAETGDSNWIPAFAGKEFDNIAGRTMTDSFSSAYDSARNFLRRRWPWVVDALDKIPRKAIADFFSSVCDSVRNFLRYRWGWLVGALILYFFFGNWIASVFGYAETVTETVIENGKSVGKETTSWLSPGARLFRDFLIGIAAVFGIAMAGWRNFALDRQSKAASEQAQNDSNRIAGEQFSDAVKLLTQKDAEHKPAIDARIGGIYSLQTLANNRIEEYGAQVVKTLIAYIKQNAQLTAQPPLIENETPKEARALGEDVKTAFNVLEQLLAAREKDSAKWNEPSDGIKLSDQDLSFSGQNFSRLDLNSSQVDGLHHYIWSQVNLQSAKLQGAKLQGAELWGVKLQGADLLEADLQGADLTGAKLQGALLLVALLRSANLVGAELREANLAGAELQGANLVGAELQGAILSEAELQGANLAGAELQYANLSKAELQGANLARAELQGANLAGAELQYADLSEAKLNDETTLPSNLSGKIWHSRQPKLSEIASLSPDAEWDLDPFLRSGYALVGVLSNFSGRRRFLAGKGVIRAKKLRIAARKLLDEKKLPENFPQDWRDWLSGITLDSSHPDDSKSSG